MDKLKKVLDLTKDAPLTILKEVEVVGEKVSEIKDEIEAIKDTVAGFPIPELTELNSKVDNLSQKVNGISNEVTVDVQFV